MGEAMDGILAHRCFLRGQARRAAFAVAAHLEPEILIVDEVLAVGDAAFQKKVFGEDGRCGARGTDGV